MPRTKGQLLQSFSVGQGLAQPEPFCCADCGYESPKRKNFKRTEDKEGYTCSTGHYDDGSGLKRVKNPYAR